MRSRWRSIRGFPRRRFGAIHGPVYSRVAMETLGHLRQRNILAGQTNNKTDTNTHKVTKRNTNHYHRDPTTTRRNDIRFATKTHACRPASLFRCGRM